jgi:hypothetical protein
MINNAMFQKQISRNEMKKIKGGNPPTQYTCSATCRSSLGGLYFDTQVFDHKPLQSELATMCSNNNPDDNNGGANIVAGSCVGV